ncbi:MAG TPA: hypothetical protein VGD65_02285 [Chryseosolibacter sp.]
MKIQSLILILWPVALVAASTCPVRAQALDIEWVEVAGRTVIVHYDLEDENPLHAYTVNLFSSADNFANPLVKLSGDVGNEIKPGNDKRIRWNITEELGLFAGEIELEVRAKMYVPFMKMTEFDTRTKYKRGKNYPLVWRSGNPGGQIDIELLLDGVRVSSDRNVPNTGKFDWQIPPGAKPSSGYQLKFTNTKSRDETFVTEPFKVVAQIPMIAKAAAAAALGVTIILLANRKEGGGTVEPDLPDFDTVPGN